MVLGRKLCVNQNRPLVSQMQTTTVKKSIEIQSQMFSPVCRKTLEDPREVDVEARAAEFEPPPPGPAPARTQIGDGSLAGDRDEGGAVSDAAARRALV
jgi:hypothetical protein